jgi:hypothetical protein
MFPLGLIAGSIAGYALTSSVAGAIAGGIGLPAALFVAQAAIGLRSMRRGRDQVPVDLTGTPELTTAALRTGYESLPLAQRNAIIAQELARSSGRPVELVATILADMMGRNRMSSLASQRASASVSEGIRADRVDRDRVSAICAGELSLAPNSSMPPNDRVRAIAERNLGVAIDRTIMARAIVTTNMPLMHANVAGLIEDAIDGRRDLALVVGTIRRVGEHHAREMVKIR